MIRREINTYDWICIAYFSVSEYWRNEILDTLKECGADDFIMRRVDENMRHNQMDTGFTYSNLKNHKSIMVIGKASSGAEFLNSFCHELRHLVDDIAKSRGYDMGGEEVAYLTGEIALQFSDIVCNQSCDFCRED